MLKKLDNIIFYKNKVWVYLIFLFIVIYINDYELLLKILLDTLYMTFFWFIFVILPRKYLYCLILRINIFIFNKFKFIIKLRNILFDIPLYMQILFSFFIYIEMIIWNLLFLNKEKTFCYFFRLNVFYNFLILSILPLYLFLKFYENFILSIEECRNLSISEYLFSRLNFFVLTTIFIMIAGLTRADFLLLIFLLEHLLMIYVYLIRMFFANNRSYYSVAKRCNLLHECYASVNLTINNVAIYAFGIYLKRYKCILLFDGLNFEDDSNFNFIFIISLKNYFFQYFWNKNFFVYQKLRIIFFDYNFCEFKYQFVLRIFVRLYCDKYGKFNKDLLNLSVEQLLAGYKLSVSVNKFFCYCFIKDLYEFIVEIFFLLKQNTFLFNQLYILLSKYDFMQWSNFYLQNDVKFFIDNLLKYIDKNKFNKFL